MKITVVGGTGMIGSRVVAEAARRGHEVTSISAEDFAVAIVDELEKPAPASTRFAVAN